MNYETRPDDLPVPTDDGAADHLSGSELPSLELQSTSRTRVDLSSLKGTLVLYAYPMTGQPGKALPDGWDEIPGARGCTPQSCSFRDHMTELTAAGADHVFGVSTQTSEYQKEAADRLHLPFALLSDSGLELRQAMNLPSFEAEIEGQNPVLLKRLALIARNGVVEKVFYPVFPPEKNATDVLQHLKDQ
ncbi:MAG: peroxiredoxin [Rhizobiaceae bacterium]